MSNKQTHAPLATIFKTPNEPVTLHPSLIDDDSQESNEYREASLKMLGLLNLFYDFVDSADNPFYAFVAAGYALGLASIQGEPLSSRARKIGTTPAHLSKLVEEFSTIANLPPSPYQYDTHG